ncbi:MAG: glycosyltransferase family 25 protein [Pseudomonadota bacterium]
MALAPSGAPAQMIPAFMVSLARATDRRAVMAAEVHKAAISVTFVDAVDSRAPDGAKAIAALPETGPWGLNHAHDRACTLSHLKVLRAFLETPSSHALVMEDDVFLAEDLAFWLGETAWWPKDADIVKLERWRDDRLFVALETKAHQAHKRALRAMRSRHSGSGGYVISRRAAELVLAAGTPDVPIDHLYFNASVSPLARQLRSYQAVPALVVQGNEPARPSHGAPPSAVHRDSTRKSRLASLKRGWHEIKGLPGLLALALLGRIRFEKIQYAAQVAP